MQRKIMLIRYIGALLALIMVVAACTGGSSDPTPTPEGTVVAMEPTPQQSPTPRPGDTRNINEDEDGDGVFGDLDLCPDVAGTVDGCLDSDADGISDAKDACPDSLDIPFGVDGVGCPIGDEDGDLFSDLVDVCPAQGDIFGYGIYEEGADKIGCPIADIDNDTVPDNLDNCPAEGDLGDGVDELGCPNPAPNPDPVPDTDGDGIDDNTDQCPSETDAYGFGIDEFGCAITDLDNDGVPDNRDDCPQAGDDGYGVNEVGCPYGNPDVDGDGVLNIADACLDEGDLGFGVDAIGCPNPPQDTDSDGFPDNVDACPQEPNLGLGLDERGCPYRDNSLDPNGDYDLDNFLNKDDACPRLSSNGGGLDAFGCPVGSPAPDTDGDGRPDVLDDCPIVGDLGNGLTPRGCPNNDGDSDGVLDGADQCPNQGNLGVGVDANGCPIPDTDGDGVPDNADQCPNQGSVGSGVDANGCPIADGDGDGVPDSTDQCPNEGNFNVPNPRTGTLTFYAVNAEGCQVDSDNDGIRDYLDYCPVIGSSGDGVIQSGLFIGCPTNDTDYDGFLDNVDACPQSGNLGLGVDETGCSYTLDRLNPNEDLDNDGFLNNVDACPQEPNLGLGLDERGCPYTDNRLNPNEDYDLDNFLNKDDACPRLSSNGGGLDAFGCPVGSPAPDTDGDGRPDPIDDCPTQGDLGGGLTPRGCPVLTVVEDAVAINMGITGECVITNGVAVAVFTLTNPNQVDINNGYTDQDGVAGVANVPANGTSTVNITPNAQGFARIKFDNVANFAEVSGCVAPAPTPDVTPDPEPRGNSDPRVTINVECIGDYNGHIVLTFENFEGYILNGFPAFEAGILFDGSVLINGTNTVYATYANATYPHGKNDLYYTTDNNAAGQTVVFRYVDVLAVIENIENGGAGNYVYATYEVPSCVPALAEVTDVPETTPQVILSVSGYTCSFNNNGDAIVSYTITNKGPNAVAGANEVTLAGIETNTIPIQQAIGGDLAVGGTLIINTRPDANGFVTTSIPAIGFSYANPTPCPPAEPTIITSAECVGDYMGEITLTLAGFDAYTFTDYRMFADGVQISYEFRFDDNSVFGANTGIFADGTFTIPYTSQDNWRNRQIGFIYDSVRNIIGADDNETASIVLPRCLPDHVEYSVSVSQSCNPETGINTITLTATNTVSLLRALTFAGANSEDIRRYYQFTSTGLSVINEQYFVSEGAFVYELNSDGKTEAFVSYANPAWVNTNAQSLLNITGNVFAGDEYTTVALELCGTPDVPVLPDPVVTIVSATCAADYVGEIEISFANFNNYMRQDGTEPFLGGFDYRYQISDEDQTLSDVTTRYEDGTFIITYTTQEAWRGKNLYIDYQTAQSVVNGSLALTSYPLPDCLPQLLPDFDITFTQSCNPETGINTITFTPVNFATYQYIWDESGVPIPENSPYSQYLVGTNRDLQYFPLTANPVTVELDTNGALQAATMYINPALINHQMRIFILGEAYTGSFPIGGETVMYELDICGAPPPDADFGEIKAVEPTFICETLTQELVITFDFLTPQELTSLLQAQMQNMGGGIDISTMMFLMSGITSNFLPVNYYIHAGIFDANGTFIQSGIHNPVEDGDLTLRVPYSALAGGNINLSYVDFQPLIDYQIAVFEALLNEEDPNTVSLPDLTTIFKSIPLSDCSVAPNPIEATCEVYNGQTVAVFDITGYNVVNYTVNTAGSLLQLGDGVARVIVYPDQNGYASISYGAMPAAEITCAPPPELTPEATPAPTGELVLPVAPVLSVSAITCDNNTANLTLSVSGIADYNAKATAMFNAFGLQYNPLVGLPGLFGDNVTVFVSHTTPLPEIAMGVSLPDTVIAFGTIPIATLTDGTYTIPITAANLRPAGTPIYVNFTNAYRLVTWLYLYFEPLLTKVNNGETITQEEILEVVFQIQELNGTPSQLMNRQVLETISLGTLDVPCLTAPDIEATPEPTPEATQVMDLLTLPDVPTFSIDSINCPMASSITITATNGDFTAYSQALNAVLSQILPEGIPSGVLDVTAIFNSLGMSGLPVFISHTTALSGYNTTNLVAYTQSGIPLTVGTHTITIPLTGGIGGIGGIGGVGVIPSDAPIFVNVVSLRQFATFFNTLLQPLVDKYNSTGQRVTEADLQVFASSLGNSSTLMSALIYSEQVSDEVRETCFGSPEYEDVTIEVTEQCDNSTGINTVSFTITGSDGILLVTGGSAIPFAYSINGTNGELPFEDGTQTITVDTNGLSRVTLQYMNPEYINTVLQSLLGGGSPNSSLSQYVSRILTICGTEGTPPPDGGGGELTIPEPPTVSIDSVSCPNEGEIVVMLTFGDPTAFVTGLSDVFGALLGQSGMSFPFSMDMLSSFSNMPIIITHTSPVDISTYQLGGAPTNLVGYVLGGLGSLTGTQTFTVTLTAPAPAGAPLYLNFINPYNLLKVFADLLQPLVDKYNNGETISTQDITNAFSSLLGGGSQEAMIALFAQLLQNYAIDQTIADSCTFKPFDIQVTEQCDYTTGINTISYTQSRTVLLASYLQNAPEFTFPVSINDTVYNPAIADGTTTYTVDTNALTSLSITYPNPVYINGAFTTGSSGQIPEIITRNLTVCPIGSTPQVTPTEEITPIVTPTEDVTPIVTPTEDVTPIVTPTEDVTPIVTPTEDVTPVVTPTEDVTPVVTPTEGVTPEATPTSDVTPVVTPEATVVVEIPTLPPFPTLPPLPTLEVVPDDFDSGLCGLTVENGFNLPIIDLSGIGCGAQEERPAQNWSPIVIGGAVCLPEIIYHTDETGDWEIFWASASRAPENLSRGTGYIDLAPTRSPDGNWIAFSSNRDGNWELYASTVDGSIVVRLTDNNNAVDFDPSWSPDGTKIVYESNVDGNWELRMIDLITGEKTRLTNHAAPDINPAWHPDGTHIAFQSAREDGLWQIYELEIATGTITRLSDGTTDDTDPAYSPDGNAILYKSTSGDARSLSTMNRIGEVIAIFALTSTNVNNAIWSSDGAYIAYEETAITGITSIMIYDVAYGTIRQLTTGANAFSPAWICDSTNVVFTSNARGDNNLYVLNAIPMDSEPQDVTVLDPNIGGDANQRDPQNSPSEENASRGGALPPK